MKNSVRNSAIAGILTVFTGSSALAQVQTYCTNIAGNISCTSYDHGANSQSYCTSIGGNLSCTTYSNDYSRVQIQRNYEAGQVIGTALGNIIVAAIEEYKTNKQAREAKQATWDQFVQDTLATTELACEGDPKHDLSAEDCRTTIFLLNQFLRIHKKDFVPDGRNVGILADALDALGRTLPPDQQSFTEDMIERAYRTIDKKKLDKKIYVGNGNDRSAW
jgi:hypothetical protein